MPEVMVVTHRGRTMEELARQLAPAGVTPRARSCSVTRLFALRHRWPPVVLVDVPELFGEPDVADPPPLEPDSPAIVVVGFRDDLDAALAAANEGVHVHILEQLAPAALAETLGLHPPTSDHCLRLGRLWATRVHALWSARCWRLILTPRELEILVLIRAGRSNAEIGRRLGVAEKTVRNYATSIFDKLGMAGRYGAICCRSG